MHHPDQQLKPLMLPVSPKNISSGDGADVTHYDPALTVHSTPLQQPYQVSEDGDQSKFPSAQQHRDTRWVPVTGTPEAGMMMMNDNGMSTPQVRFTMVAPSGSSLAAPRAPLQRAHSVGELYEPAPVSQHKTGAWSTQHGPVRRTSTTLGNAKSGGGPSGSSQETLLRRTAALLGSAARNILPQRAIPRTAAESAHEGFVRGQFKHLLLRDIFWIFSAFLTITAVEAEYGRVSFISSATFDGQNRIYADVFRTMFELISAYGTVGLSLGTDDLPTGVSFSHSLTGFSKLCIVLIMLLGRHRNMPSTCLA